MNFATEFGNSAWQEELRKIPGLKDCQFPASTEIKFSGTREQVTIMMTNNGLRANMQTDAAAFEAWALALLLHCRVQSIQIGLDTGAADAEGLHYQRYLYRLTRFCDLFPGRVFATPPAAAPRALDPHVKRLLNKPNARKQPPDIKSKERLLTASAAYPSRITEALLENALEVSSAFQKRFRLDKWMRQWPVGLFRERVADGFQIFPGRKSAIDLVGIRDDTLVLFELKKSDNRKAGAVSELLFYASVMREPLRRHLSVRRESGGSRRTGPLNREGFMPTLLCPTIPGMARRVFLLSAADSTIEQTIRLRTNQLTPAAGDGGIEELSSDPIGVSVNLDRPANGAGADRVFVIVKAL